MKDIDTKLVIWVITVIFLAGGAWWSLSDVSADVSKIQETLDGQESELTIHVAADGHTAGEGRIEKIEASQDEMGRDIKSLMTNQSAICQATGARCR
tara:strand:- start:269 stop:559 length:291 start_codon:yes stop_codon:yes gene_type:complete